MSKLTITGSRRERQGKRTVEIVSIQGELDAHTFPAFQERMDALAAAGERALVVDCTALTYVSSAGLGVLKRIVKDLRTDGGDIRLAALSEKIRNIVNLLGFSKVILCYDTVEEAVGSF